MANINNTQHLWGRHRIIFFLVPILKIDAMDMFAGGMKRYMYRQQSHPTSIVLRNLVVQQKAKSVLTYKMGNSTQIFRKCLQ